MTPASGKKAITQDTYDEWRTIQGATLSPDGKWTVYTLSPVVGEGDVGDSAQSRFRPETNSAEVDDWMGCDRVRRRLVRNAGDERRGTVAVARMPGPCP